MVKIATFLRPMSLLSSACVGSLIAIQACGVRCGIVGYLAFFAPACTRVCRMELSGLQRTVDARRFLLPLSSSLVWTNKLSPGNARVPHDGRHDPTF